MIPFRFSIILLITEDKVTEIFCIADVFCIFFAKIILPYSEVSKKF